MSKVLTFSRTFPAYHPRKGEPTFFVEKMCNSFLMVGYSIYTDSTPIDFLKSLSKNLFEPKHHTIRAGNRWEVGDKFSPRVWSGKPYASKQIIIAPDIEVKKVWDIEISFNPFQCLIPTNEKNKWLMISNGEVANNDGLEVSDFMDWFKKPKQGNFIGQIICWNESINY